MIFRIAIALAALFCLTRAGAAQEEPANPYALYYAEVVRVIDGDTLDVRVDLWPGLQAIYAVRVRGIDAPELRRAGCEAERRWAAEAKAQVEKLYDVGSRVRLENVEYDAYSGRVAADVRRWRSDRWIYLADELVERSLAVAWTPDMDDVPWCLLAQTR